MNKIIKPINQRIAKYRTIAGYTQETAAEALGMKKNTYAYMERYGNPTHEQVFKLANLYNISPSVLFMGEDYDYKKEMEKLDRLKSELPVRLSEPTYFEIKKSPEIILTATERSFIGGLRELTREQKEFISQQINKMREENKKTTNGEEE